MQHVDEGTLHALLDGELPAEEAAQVRLHFATCPSCSARLDEARQLLAETERLVSALELPGMRARSGRGDAAAGSRAAAAAASAVADVLVPPSPSTPLPPLDPVVLIPENPTPREVRRTRIRYMAWAAGFLVVVGAGYLGVTGMPLQQAPPRNAQMDLSPDEFTTVPGTLSQARPDSAPTLALTDSEAPSPSDQAKDEAAAAAAPAAPEAKEAPAEPAAPRRDQPPPSPPAAAQKTPPAAAPETQPAESREEPPPAAKVAEERAAPEGRASEPVANRQTAAQATAELDRRRTRVRAAEATAALERERAERLAA
jgi:hypothetical protein